MRTFSTLVPILLLAACAQPRHVASERSVLPARPNVVFAVESPPARASADRSPPVRVAAPDMVASFTVTTRRVTQTREERFDEPFASAPAPSASAGATEFAGEPQPAPEYCPPPRSRSVWDEPATYMAIDAAVRTSIWVAMGFFCCH